MVNKELVNNLFEYHNGELYWKNHKYKALNGKKVGSLQPDGYVSTKINKKAYKLHRLIFLYHHGYLPVSVDHIDCNPLNNKIDNLREATASENSRNAKLSKANTSGHKGVCLHKKSGKWVVQLWVNKKQRTFGLYKDIDYAVFVANAMRYKYHKDYARIK